MDWECTVPHKQWVALPEGFWTRMSFSGVRRGNMETGHDWLGGRGLPYEAPMFWGNKLAKADWEDCAWCVFGFLDRCFL